MSSAALAGSTGFVGSNILSQLLAHPSISAVHAYARRDLPNPASSTKLHPIQSADTSAWPSRFPSPPPSIFFSGLGTTRAAAGSTANQRKIDLDLNLDLARAAKNAGCETYVLISSAGASSGSRFPYTQMKGELEDGVVGLGFKHCVILRPGLIGGTREESRPAEAVLRTATKGMRWLVPGFVDMFSQDADVIARAAVKAALDCVEGKRDEGTWVITQPEIVKLVKEQ